MKVPRDKFTVTELNKCYLWKEDNPSIIFGTAKKESHQTLEDAKEIMDTLLTLSNGEKTGFVFDLTGILSQNKEARDYYSSPVFMGKFFAIAIITKSIIARVIANFYMGLNKPSNPTRVFNDEESAIQWTNSMQLKQTD